MTPKEQKALAMAFMNTFESESGKRVLAHLSKFCHENSATFMLGDQNKTSYNEGQRSVILSIRRFMNMNFTKEKRNG